MNLCHYSDIMQGAATLAGLSYSRTVGSAGLADSEEAAVRQAASFHLGQLWPMAAWPGLIRYEQRQFRATYASGTAYTAGQEVYWPQEDAYYQAIRSTTGNAPTDSSGTLTAAYWAECERSLAGEDYSSTTAYTAGDIVYYTTDGNYYQCHTASTGNAPTNTSYWGRLYPFEPYIAFAQTGETEMDQQAEIILYTADPRNITRHKRVLSILTEDGVVPIESCPNRPWVKFKVVCPKLTGERFSATATYAVGDQVQFETSSGNVSTVDFYDCVSATSAGQSPSTHSAKWDRVEIPDYFKQYLAAVCARDFLIGDDDQKFAIADRAADEAMQVLHNTLYRAQQQVPQTQIGTY